MTRRAGLPEREITRRRRRSRDPEGKAALFSASSTHPRPGRAVAVQCGACGTTTELSYLDFVLANLPFGVWVPPLVRFNRRMTCPACNEWTWMRARWW